MPIYEYRCSKCGKTFEKIQKFSDAPVVVHEECGGPVERLISTSALQFKGSGWYVNDYAKGSSKSVESKSESKGESKSESKSGDSGSSGSGESKSGESKSSDSKSSDSKSGDSKSSESKSGDSKSGKPAPASKSD